MICERPYNPERDPDDDPRCFTCEGHGFRRWFDVDAGWEHEPCPACDGIATAGVFVLRILTARFQHELRYHTANLPRALARAERFAALSSGLRMFGSRASEVRVIFLRTEEGRTLPSETVARIAVPVPSLTPTAA